MLVDHVDHVDHVDRSGSASAPSPRPVALSLANVGERCGVECAEVRHLIRAPDLRLHPDGQLDPGSMFWFRWKTLWGS
jgi:hypothetical protein